MRALVFGSRGLLGQALVSHLPSAGWHLAGALGHADCDIASPDDVRRALEAARPDAVFNAAAFTDVDGAEDRADAAYRTNALGAEVLARACAAQGSKLIHYSTDFVFDGESARPYDEFDPPSPQGLYARSKVAGERLALAASPRAFVMRVGCLYGRGGRNFPSTLLRRILAGEPIRADKERLGSPTWAVTVAELSGALARTDHFGLYHATADGETSWVDFARFLATEVGRPDAPIEGLPTAALPMRAARPRRSILENRMLRLRDLDTAGDWKHQARRYLASEQAAAASTPA